uniref:DUF4806 domain-containing protein n=1 Tax=Myripristis murdjan TaxID=586833 RepID=A0A667YTF4_9TELE
MFKIVEFLETNEVELVPGAWVKDNVCLWPALRGKALETAIKQQVSPGPDWMTWNIRVMFTTGMYMKIFLKKFFFLSVVLYAIIKFGEFDFLNCFKQIIIRKGDRKSGKQNGDQTFSQMQRTAVEGKQGAKPLMREMLTKQEMILEQQAHMLHLQKAKDQDMSEYHLDEGLLPVRDREGLLNLEVKLQDADIRSKLVSSFLVGGFDIKDTVWRIMKQTITNNLAKHTNWRGINGKMAMSSLQLKNVVIAAVRKNPLTAKASEHEIELWIKRWLQLAADREGGRKRRALHADGL